MSRRWRVKYISPDGTKWDLTSDRWVAGLKAGGIKGLVGSLDAQVITPIGGVGQRVVGFRPAPRSGSLTVLLRPSEPYSLPDVWVDFRSGFVAGQYGWLVVKTPTGDWHLRVRPGGELPEPEYDDADASAMTVDIPLISDEGVWWSEEQEASRVVYLVNPGSVPIYPVITWSGAGGEVTLPSGARFTLPRSEVARGLFLDPSESLVVMDTRQVVDHELWAALRKTALPEGVPPGETRRYALPDGANCLWRVGVLDPWR